MNTPHPAPISLPRNILLIYPQVPDTYWSYRHALSFVGKRAVMPPLGLLTVAAIMGERYSYRLVDTNVTPLSEEDLGWADMAFVSAMIVQRESLAAVIARCNRWDVPVVAGGPYPTACHEEISGVDHFVLGEAEMILPQFCSDLERGTLRPLYRPDRRPELGEVPIPRFDLCDLDAYETIPLQFSRGCPFNCEFCDIVSLFGHRVRTKTTDHMLRELEVVYQTGFRGNIFIVDDNFIGNRRRVKDLLRGMAAWQTEHRYPYRIATEASIDLAHDDELLSLMVSAGFKMVFVGLETPVEASLASAGKQQNLRQDMTEAVHRMQRVGIEVTGGFIVGFDTDPADIFDRQITFIQELGIPTAMVGMLMALPGTRLWQRLVTEDRILSRSSGDNTHQGELNFRTRMDRSTLVTGYRRVLQQTYSPRHYFARGISLLRRLPRAPATRRRLRIGWREVTALLRSLTIQGSSRYALWYWSFVVRAIAIRPRMFEHIFKIAIQGHHFFVITGMMLRRPAGLPPGAHTAVSSSIHRVNSGLRSDSTVS
ncbi:MAG: B12-binding domain-containing radical SAM protein [Alkalispirochaeta sp.]